MRSRRLVVFALVVAAVAIAQPSHPGSASAAAVWEPAGEPADEPIDGDLNGDGVARVAAVGDSILEGAAREIEQGFRAAGYEAVVDTSVSRSTRAGVEPVRLFGAMGVDAIIVMLGANDAADPEVFRARAADVVAAADGVPQLYWMTIPEVRDYYPAANSVLRGLLADRNGGHVLDWSAVAATGAVTAGDGLHLTPDGVGTMSGFVVASVVAGMAPPGAVDGATVGGGDAEASTPGAPGVAGVADPLAGAVNAADDPGAASDRPTDDGRRAGPADSIDTVLGGEVLGRTGLGLAVTLVVLALTGAGLGLGMWALWRTRPLGSPESRGRGRVTRVAGE